jgi:XTP/dITP diphosphohydrolase
MRRHTATRRHTSLRVVLATSNPGKHREFAALLEPLGMELILQSTLGITAVSETGASFAANALLKAAHAAAQSGLAALADDSGLEVDVLNGRPGIHSARYAGEQADDEANNRLLIHELRAMTDATKRTARYRCVLTLVRGPAEVAPIFAHGSWEGHIAQQARGSGGFGYDPWFIPHGMTITAAEMSAADKNAVSHRGLALRALTQALAQAVPAWP